MDFQTLSIEELVQECARSTGDEAWTEFRRRFHRLIAKVIIRVCREFHEYTQETVEDLMQDTYTKLLTEGRALLTRFQAHHEDAFLGYIQTVAANVAYDHFRAQRAQKRNVEATVELSDAIVQVFPGPATAVHAEIFFRETDEHLLLRGNGPDQQRERAIFWLHFRDGLTAREISELPGVPLGVKGVESVIFRLIRYLRNSLSA